MYLIHILFESELIATELNCTLRRNYVGCRSVVDSSAWGRVPPFSAGLSSSPNRRSYSDRSITARRILTISQVTFCGPVVFSKDRGKYCASRSTPPPPHLEIHFYPLSYKVAAGGENRSVYNPKRRNFKAFYPVFLCINNYFFYKVSRNINQLLKQAFCWPD